MSTFKNRGEGGGGGGGSTFVPTKANLYAAVKAIFHPGTNAGVAADDSNSELDVSGGGGGYDPSVKAITASTYSIVAADKSNTIVFTGSGSSTFSLPAIGTGVAVGFTVRVACIGSGSLSVGVPSGYDIRGPGGDAFSNALTNFEGATLQLVTTTRWLVIADPRLEDLGGGDGGPQRKRYFEFGALEALNFSNTTVTEATGSYSYLGGGVTGSGRHAQIAYTDLHDAVIRWPVPNNASLIIADFGPALSTDEERAAVNGTRFWIVNTGTNSIPNSRIRIGGIGSVFPSDAAIEPNGVIEVFLFAAPTGAGNEFDDNKFFNVIFTPHDEVEDIPTLSNSTPVKPDNTSGTAGTAASASRSDHKHPLPSNATTSANGLMASEDKTKVDAIPSVPDHTTEAKKYELNVPATSGNATWAEASDSGTDESARATNRHQDREIEDLQRRAADLAIVTDEVWARVTDTGIAGMTLIATGATGATLISTIRSSDTETNTTVPSNLPTNIQAYIVIRLVDTADPADYRLLWADGSSEPVSAFPRRSDIDQRISANDYHYWVLPVEAPENGKLTLGDGIELQHHGIETHTEFKGRIARGTGAGTPPREITGSANVYTLLSTENIIYVKVLFGSRTFSASILRAELSGTAKAYVLDTRNPAQASGDANNAIVGFSASISGNDATINADGYQGTIDAVYGVVSGAKGEKGDPGDGSSQEIVNVTTARTLTSSDIGKALRYTGAPAAFFRLPDITGDVGIGSRVTIINDSSNAAGRITIDPNSNDTINGLTTWEVPRGQRVVIQAITSTSWSIVGGIEERATTSRAGIVEIATDAEHDPTSGTPRSDAVATPRGVRATVGTKVTSTEKGAGTGTEVRRYSVTDIVDLIRLHTRIGVITKNANSTLVAGERGRVIRLHTTSNTKITATLPQIAGAGIGVGWDVWILNDTPVAAGVAADRTTDSANPDDIGGDNDIDVLPGHAIHLIASTTTEWSLIANTEIGTGQQGFPGSTSSADAFHAIMDDEVDNESQVTTSGVWYLISQNPTPGLLFDGRGGNPRNLVYKTTDDSFVYKNPVNNLPYPVVAPSVDFDSEESIYRWIIFRNGIKYNLGFGEEAKIGHNNAVAIGRKTEAQSNSSFALGDNSLNKIAHSLLFGRNAMLTDSDTVFAIGHSETNLTTDLRDGDADQNILLRLKDDGKLVIKDLYMSTDPDASDGTQSQLYSQGEKTKLGGIETNATRDQSATEIKTAYESNTDTNAFTDADHTKLDGLGNEVPEITVYPPGLENFDDIEGTEFIVQMGEQLSAMQDNVRINFGPVGDIVNENYDGTGAKIWRITPNASQKDAIKTRWESDGYFPVILRLYNDGNWVSNASVKVLFGPRFAEPTIPTIAPPEATTYYKTQVSSTATAPAFATPVWDAAQSRFTGVTTGWSTTRPTSVSAGDALWIAQVWRTANGTVLHIITRELSGFNIRYFEYALTSSSNSVTYDSAVHQFYRLRGPDGNWGPFIAISPATDLRQVVWHTVFDIGRDISSDGNYDLPTAHNLGQYTELRYRIILHDRVIGGVGAGLLANNEAREFHLPAIRSNPISQIFAEHDDHTGGNDLFWQHLKAGNGFNFIGLERSSSLETLENWGADQLDTHILFRRPSGHSTTSQQLHGISWKGRGGGSTQTVRIILEGR